MRKPLVAALIAIGFAMPEPSVQASTASPLQIVINHSPVSFEQSPMLYHDFTMVPMRDIFQKMGADMEWNQQTQSITANKQDKFIELKIGSPHAWVNYQPVSMDAAPILVNGRAFVPLRFVSQSLGAKVEWDQQTKTVNIIYEENKVQSEELPLTWSMAVDWARKTSDTLKKAEQAIKRNEIILEEAEHTVNTTVNRTNDTWENLFSADIALQMAKKEKVVAEDQLVFLVKQAYQDIFLKEKEIEIKQMAYDIAQMEEEVALAKDQIGQISVHEKEAALKAKLAAGQSLQQAKTALKEARAKLNLFIGKSKGTVYRLADKPTYKKLEDLDMDSYIENLISLNPSIWQLEKKVEMAKRKAEDSRWDQGQSYELAKLDLEQAQSALLDSKDRFGESIRNMYLNLQDLNHQYDMLQRNLQTAEEQLQMVQTQYEKGWVTTIEVKKAELDVKDMQKAIDEMVMKIDLAGFKLKKPWVR